jgi:hypothetical protein
VPGAEDYAIDQRPPPGERARGERAAGPAERRPRPPADGRVGLGLLVRRVGVIELPQPFEAQPLAVRQLVLVGGRAGGTARHAASASA